MQYTIIIVIVITLNVTGNIMLNTVFLHYRQFSLLSMLKSLRTITPTVVFHYSYQRFDF